MERKTIGYGEELTKPCKMFVQKQLLTYLLTDELKHDKLLTQLEDFKKQASPVRVTVSPAPRKRDRRWDS